MTKLKLWQLFLGLLFFYILISALHAQQGVKFIYLNDPTNDYIDYLVNSGKHIPGFVFYQPYELDSTLLSGGKDEPGQYFAGYWSRFYGDKQISARILLRDELRSNDGVFFERGVIAGPVHYVSGHITLANRIEIAEDFEHDPFYAGDLSEADRIFGRVKDAYLNLRFNKFNFFLGRMQRNWGPPGSPSLILSDHPYTYDHLLLSYSTKTLKLSVIFAQLEELTALSFDLDAPEIISIVPNAKKYLVGHRLDIRFSERIQVALTEMATYGGPGRDVDFLFFNPMNFYYAIQRNDGRGMNGKWALDLFYKPKLPLAFYFQFLLDDIILNTDEPDEREKREDRFGLMISIRTGDLVEGLNTNLTYVRVWNRTYQSFNTWENYHFRELSLGYPCASCEEIRFKWDYWGFFPWFIGNESILGRYGDARLTDFYPYNKETFPLEPVTNNFLNDFTLRYFYHPAISVWAKARFADKGNHYANRIDELPGWTFFLGAEVNFGLSIKAE